MMLVEMFRVFVLAVAAITVMEAADVPNWAAMLLYVFGAAHVLWAQRAALQEQDDGN